MSSNLYLVWLEWPEKCFRVDAETLRSFRSLVRGRGRVVRVRSEAAFLKNLPRATHAIVWNFKKEWFAKAPRLKVLATPAAGQEFVPTEGPKGVRIHFGHYHGRIIAESVAAFALGWAHGFFAVRNAPASCRDWPRNWLSDKCFDVAGTKAVVVGYGHVGRAIGAKLESLGVEVEGFSRSNIGNLAKSAGTANWLILALPSATGTDDFLNAKLIRKLPRTCVVINVGRGNAVDEKALYAALKAKRIAGAYLDVRKHEPSATVLESPGYVPELAKLPNCITTPHSAAFGKDYLWQCLMELNLDRCL